MFLARFASWSTCLLLGLGWAATAQAKPYSLAGGGGQLAVPGSLPMPLQVFTPGMTGTVFPPLGIPANTAKIVQGTTAMSVKQRLTLPTGVLSRPAQQGTLGVFAHRWGTFYALGTNLGFQWPAAAAVFSTQARTGAKTTTFVGAGGWIRYSNASASKFGGPARFAISHGVGGRIANAPVTLYGIAYRPSGNPPCTHTALTPATFPGTYATNRCVAVLVAGWPLTQGVIGGPVGASASTVPLGNPLPGVGIGKFGASPPGTVSFFTFTPSGTMSGFTDRAQSVGYPWTTGMLTITHGPHMSMSVFTLTGMDNRTPGGAGTIQLVAGGLSLRAVTRPTANRGWVRLQLAGIPATPALSPAGLAATAGLLLMAAGYALRRRLSA